MILIRLLQIIPCKDELQVATLAYKNIKIIDYVINYIKFRDGKNLDDIIRFALA